MMNIKSILIGQCCWKRRNYSKSLNLYGWNTLILRQCLEISICDDFIKFMTSPVFKMVHCHRESNNMKISYSKKTVLMCHHWGEMKSGRQCASIPLS